MCGLAMVRPASSDFWKAPLDPSHHLGLSECGDEMRGCMQLNATAHFQTVEGYSPHSRKRSVPALMYYS